MVLRAVDHFQPNETDENADDSHEVEHIRPAKRRHQPAHDGRKQGGREVLRGVEDGRSRGEHSKSWGADGVGLGSGLTGRGWAGAETGVAGGAGWGGGGRGGGRGGTRAG